MKSLRLLEIAGAVVAGTLLARLLPVGDFGYALLAAGALTLLAAFLAAASARGDLSRRMGTQLVLFLVLGTNRPSVRIADTPALRLFLLGAAVLAGLLLGVFLLPLI